MYGPIGAEETRRIVDFEHQLALSLIRGKALPIAWTSYCRPATFLAPEPEGENINGLLMESSERSSISHERDVGLQLEDDQPILEYPDQLPTSLERDIAFKEMETTLEKYSLDESLCPALLMCIASSYVAFLLDTRLSFLVTRRYGSPQLGIFSHVPLDPKDSTALGLEGIAITMSFTIPPPDMLESDGLAWGWRRMREEGFGTETTAECHSGGIALYVGPARFANHTCRHPNLRQFAIESGNGLDAPYAEWYHSDGFVAIKSRGSVSARSELLWTYRKNYSLPLLISPVVDDDVCQCEGHTPKPGPAKKPRLSTSGLVTKTRAGLRSDNSIRAGSSGDI